MVYLNDWSADEHDKFCETLLTIWHLEAGIAVDDRSTEKQIWSQLADKLKKLGVNRSSHHCLAHWYYLVRHQEEFRDTFPFTTPPPSNNSRNTDLRIGKPVAVTNARLETEVNNSAPESASTSFSQKDHNRAIVTFKLPENSSIVVEEQVESRNQREPQASQPSQISQHQQVSTFPPNSKLAESSQGLRSWGEEETQKLKELAKASQDMLSGVPGVSQEQVFKLISQQLKDAGFERTANSCRHRWRKLHLGEKPINSHSTDSLESTGINGYYSEPDDASDATCDGSKEPLPKLTSKRWTSDEILKFKKLVDRESATGASWSEISRKHTDQGYKRTKYAVEQQWRKMRASLQDEVERYDSEDDDVPLVKLLEKERRLSKSGLERKRNSIIKTRNRHAGYSSGGEEEEIAPPYKRARRASQKPTENQEREDLRQSSDGAFISNKERNVRTSSSLNNDMISIMRAEAKGISEQISVVVRNKAETTKVLRDIESTLLEMQAQENALQLEKQQHMERAGKYKSQLDLLVEKKSAVEALMEAYQK